MSNNNILLDYSDELEDLLKNESEKAESMSILHSKCFKKFNRLSIYINIPVIVLSAFIGFLSPLSLFQQQAIFLGSMSIFISILKTLDNFFDFTKRCETHRLIGLNYLKISKFIQIQLSLERRNRISANDLLELIINDLANLRDQEPLITKDVIKDFNTQYKNETTAKPPICNGLTNVVINKKMILDKIDIAINTEDIKEYIKIDNDIIQNNNKKKPFKI